MELLSILLFVLIGLGTGFFSALFGIGGGSIRIPLLVLSGMPIVVAFGTNMFCIPFTSSMGAYVQRKNIIWSVAKVFTLGAVLGIIVATALVGVFSDGVLAIVFFVSGILTVLGLYLQELNGRIYKLLRPTKLRLFFGALVTNLVIGLRGGSGGSLFTPLLRALHVEMHHAIATSLFASIFSSVVAVVFYLFRGDFLLLPALIVMVAGVVGSYLGSRVSLHSRSRMLRLGLAVVVVLLSFSVLYGEFW